MCEERTPSDDYVTLASIGERFLALVSTVASVWFKQALVHFYLCVQSRQNKHTHRRLFVAISQSEQDRDENHLERVSHDLEQTSVHTNPNPQRIGTGPYSVCVYVGIPLVADSRSLTLPFWTKPNVRRVAIRQFDVLKRKIRVWVRHARPGAGSGCASRRSSCFGQAVLCPSSCKPERASSRRSAGKIGDGGWGLGGGGMHPPTAGGATITHMNSAPNVSWIFGPQAARTSQDSLPMPMMLAKPVDRSYNARMLFLSSTLSSGAYGEGAKFQRCLQLSRDTCV